MKSGTLHSPSLREQLSRGLPRDKSDTLLLIGACALVMFPHAWHLPAWVTLAASALLVWRGWITFRGNRMPARWLLVPVALLLMMGVYQSYRTFLGREAGVCMLVLLLALKLLEMRARRDLFVVVFLSFFVLLTNFFYSQTIAAALLAAAGVIAILSAQMSFQFTGAHPPLRERLGMALRLFLLAAPLTLVLFVFFPRIQGPFWGMPGDAAGARTGLSDSMEPGKIAELTLSPDIAFRVQFEGAVPPPAALYWRGPVLGDYDGRRWLALSATSLPPSTRVAVGSRQVRYQVTQEPSSRQSLFALDVPVTSPTLQNQTVRIQPDMQILASQALTERVRYDVASSLEYQLQADESPVVLRDWMALPPGFNPRTHEFASELRSRSTNDLDMVNAVLQMFREQKFSYTLRPPRVGRNGVDDFLFSTRAGFCEHYAGAFVVLMRLLDIPARVVTGYQGGELNQVDGYLTVRQSDAHAWAEVWLAGRGWVRVDPTSAVAPDRVERNLATNRPRGEFGNLLFFDGAGGPWSTALQKWRDNRDAINNAWNQWVLDYTPARQRGFLQSLGIDDPDWGTLAALALTLGAAVMALIALPLVRNQEKMDPAERLYRKLCAELSRAGLPRAMHEGPLTYRTRLREAGLPPARQHAVLAFLELYESLRYGVQDANKKQNARAQANLKQLKSLLKLSR
jgi:transglutaminase-like putative cysteine protease